MRPLLLGTCILMTVSALVSNVLAQAPQKSTVDDSVAVTMTLTPAKQVIKLKEVALVSVQIKNGSSKLLRLMYVPQISTFHIYIQDANGAVPSETERGCRMHRSAACVPEHSGIVGSGEILVINPGSTATIKMDIGAEYDISRPGTYTVRVSESEFVLLDLSEKSRDKQETSPGNIQSNAVQITVLPK